MTGEKYQQPVSYYFNMFQMAGDVLREITANVPRESPAKRELEIALFHTFYATQMVMLDHDNNMIEDGKVGYVHDRKLLGFEAWAKRMDDKGRSGNDLDRGTGDHD